ncbi:PREDICTED: trypsin-4 [Drosophila arizonae]|uniref:Trypsin-4 n=1 Tax=Drosophila arizonae TaxID=7263 RepID=A0ABM1PYC2_DROAR|nr:PREDICTED: trypsin-4 [Drosophila arizonae]
MQLNDQIKRILKIMIFAFLCAEMQTTYTHSEVAKKRRIGSSASAAPYQASIRLLDQELDYFGKGHICSGALVAPSVVLTVAQCVYDQDNMRFYHPAELRVVLGSTQRFSPTAHGQVLGVTHVHKPPKQLSLAILMLEQDVSAHLTRIQPIALSVDTAQLETTSEPWHISSWGLAGEDGHEVHELLRLCVKRSPCGQQLCVKYDEQAYELDAGAPLTTANQLLGLRSQSSVFVDVASHVDWIRSQIGDGSNQNSSIWGILGLLAFTLYVIKCSCKRLNV